MNVNELKQSKFLTRHDVAAGILVTIRELEQMNVAKDGAPEEYKWCIRFDEQEKMMCLNSTNGQLIAKITGSEESDNWVGKKIVLYDDPTISYAGRIVGGIRVRAQRVYTAPPVNKTIPQGKPPPSQRPHPVPTPAQQAAETAPAETAPAADDNLPF